MRIIIGAQEARQTVLSRVSSRETRLPDSLQQLIRRTFQRDLSLEAAVDIILEDVRSLGDAALHRYNQALDGWHATSLAATALQVTPEEMEAAYEQVEPALVDALNRAAGRIRAFHQAQLEHSLRPFSGGGSGQIVRPVQRIGVYIPGVDAIYPSSVLMTAIPARVAGVSQVHMATPAGQEGRVAPAKLVAAAIAGVDAVFRVGGAQAIAAFTFGTETVPRVDKICGPGGVFVTAAKRRVYGLVGVDGVFGPSETIVIADEAANPALCAADLLAQAEHDPLATPILITNSRPLAEAVAGELERQLATLERAAEARAALDGQGGIVVADSLEEAVDLANDYAPEHLCLLVDDPEALLGRISNAGGVFLGEHSPEALGDYAVGPSHVMPTGGSARFASPLGVHDFLKVITVAAVGERELRETGPAAATIARAEGLTAHARAIERRLERKL